MLHTRDRRRLRRLAANGALVIAIAAMAGGFVYRLKVSDEVSVTTDPLTLCRTDRPLTSSTVFLVDTSDLLTGTQQSRVLARLRTVIETVPVGAKVILLQMDEHAPYEPRELISRCNPGRAKDTDGFRHNLRDAERRWHDEFEKPLQAAIAKLADAPTANRSPILQSVTGLSERADFDRHIPDRKLVLATDGLQNGQRYSQYLIGTNFWSAFRRSPLADEPQPDLAGVDVAFEYLLRPQAARLQTAEHRQFWRRWLTDAGAKSVKFYGVANDPVPPEHSAGALRPENTRRSSTPAYPARNSAEHRLSPPGSDGCGGSTGNFRRPVSHSYPQAPLSRPPRRSPMRLRLCASARFPNIR